MHIRASPSRAVEYPMPRVAILSLLLFAFILLAGGCGGSEPASRLGDAIADADPGAVHVHGLGVNPKDGTLYAATHTGLFRIPESGRAERIADRYQDTMGFIVVGPDRFLGSGHPDLREAREKRMPSLLGLIESTDAGRTWAPLSLQGQADFHALHALHGRVYGYDSTSGAFMVSGDMKTWETRSKAAMRDFAVSPMDPEFVVAAMVDNVQRSRDGGRTWERLSSPTLTLVAWRDAAALWGMTGDGAVFRSADGGDSWWQQGALGAGPAALTVHNGVLYAAAHDGGIYVSDDGGATWRLRYREAA